MSGLASTADVRDTMPIFAFGPEGDAPNSFRRHLPANWVSAVVALIADKKTGSSLDTKRWYRFKSAYKSARQD